MPRSVYKIRRLEETQDLTRNMKGVQRNWSEQHQNRPWHGVSLGWWRVTAQSFKDRNALSHDDVYWRKERGPVELGSPIDCGLVNCEPTSAASWNTAGALLRTRELVLHQRECGTVISRENLHLHFCFLLFTTVFSQWDFSRGKFGLLSPGKSSCDRVALPNLRCKLGVFLVFP